MSPSSTVRHSRLSAGLVGMLAAAIAVSACAPLPPRQERPARERVREQPVSEQPDTTVYAYPLDGQSADQQDRDRYECHVWAVKQSGFDPSVPNLPREQRV